MTTSRRTISRRQLLAGAASLTATAVLAACADDGPSDALGEGDGGVRPDSPVSSFTGGGSAESVLIQAVDNTFRPDRIEITAGTEVVWVNGGRTEHDVLPVEGDDWGVQPEDFPPGAEYRHVFTEPGEVRYYCSIHGTTERGMVGVLVVT